MTAARRFNWEAALVPCWGWLRGVPIARALSIPFPFLVVAVLDGNRPLFWPDILGGYAIVNLGYGLLYGLIGDWLLRRRARLAGNAKRDLTTRQVFVNVVGSALLIFFGLLVVKLSFSQVFVKTYAVTLKGDLRILADAQDAHHSSFGRYATSLDSLEYTPNNEVTVTLVHAGGAAWAGKAETDHQGFTIRCRISVGRWPGAPADALDREPTCDPLPGLNENRFRAPALR